MPGGGGHTLSRMEPQHWIALTAVVGAFVSPLVTQRIQARRETSARVHAERMSAYAEAAGLLIYWRSRFSESVYDGPSGPMPARPDRDWHAVLAKVSLLGGGAVRSRTQDTMEAYRTAFVGMDESNLQNFLIPGTAESRLDSFLGASEQLDEAMRRELGVTTNRRPGRPQAATTAGP